MVTAKARVRAVECNPSFMAKARVRSASFNPSVVVKARVWAPEFNPSAAVKARVRAVCHSADEATHVGVVVAVDGAVVLSA